MNTNGIGLIVGIALIVISFFVKKKMKKLEAIGETTEGVVFDFENEMDVTSTLIKYPVIRFTTKEGLWITEKTNVGATFSAFKKGDRVTIIYEAENPKNFMIKHYSTYLISNILLFTGIVFVLLNTILLLKLLN